MFIQKEKKGNNKKIKERGKIKAKKKCVWMQRKREMKEIECILYFYHFNL